MNDRADHGAGLREPDEAGETRSGTRSQLTPDEDSSEQTSSTHNARRSPSRATTALVTAPVTVPGPRVHETTPRATRPAPRSERAKRRFPRTSIVHSPDLTRT
jgi:hypothetical protein